MRSSDRRSVPIGHCNLYNAADTGKTREFSKFRFQRGLVSGSALAGSLSVLVTAIPLSVCAQDLPEAAPRTTLENIIVTSRRIEEDIQTTPVAVTALNTESLQNRQITDLQSMQYAAPNVVFTPLLGNTGVGAGIRGQVSAENTSASDPAVGIYVDGVYTARSSSGFLELVDVERIEVLRGPQGTLFGRNTTGGAINITTPQPTDTFGARLTGRYGNFNAWDVEGHVNIPISGDAVAARVSFKHGQHDNYGQSVTTGYELADNDVDFFRAVVRLAPDNANWSLTFSGDYFNRVNNGPVAAVNAVMPGSIADTVFGFGALFLPDFYDSYEQLETSEDTTASGISVTAETTVNAVTFKSITAYRSIDNHIFGTLDAAPFSLIELEQRNEQEYQFTQELQAFGRIGRADWIVGAFYFVEDNDDLTLSTTAQTSGLFKNESVAIYGQTSVSLLDSLSATVGLRYTWDDRDAVQDIQNATGTTCVLPVFDMPGQCTLTRAESYEYLSFNFGLDYQLTDNIFTYLSASRASRSGGFNNRLISPPFNPEELTNYEAGLKATIFDGRLRGNFAVFYMDYKDVQRTINFLNPITGLPTASTSNAAAAHISGFEAEVSALPIERLEVGFTVGQLNPEYDEYVDTSGDRSDEPFTFTTESNYSVYATYTHPVSFGEVLLHADYSHKGKMFFNSTNPTVDAEPDYGLINARGALRFDKYNMEVALYGRNLADTEYNTYIFDIWSELGYTVAYRGAPRTWGGEVTLKF